MKKILLMFAAVGVLFTACNKECGHEFIEHDFTKDIVGTWTCLEDGGLAEAMVIKEDGSFTTTVVMKDGSLYEEKGTIKVVNNKVTLAFDGYTDTFEGRLEFVAGKSLSIVIFDDDDVRLTYDYCENDLADEVIGMWVCNDGLTDGITIMSYSDNGKFTITTASALGTNEPLVKQESDYVVVGDLMFIKLQNADVESQSIYTAARMIYTPNGTSFGDIMTHTKYIPSGNGVSESVMSFLRVKQTLDLAGKNYDYSDVYITNVKGKNEDIEFAGNTINFAKLDGSVMDKLMKHILFNVSFDASKIYYNCYLDGENHSIDAPIVVEGNKVIVKMSENKAVYRDVEVYMFQDQDNTQMHMYMPVKSFENFIGNMQVTIMEQLGQLDTTDAAAVQAVYDSIDDAVETINVSFVMTKAK